jgi:hypothetical protein
MNEMNTLFEPVSLAVTHIVAFLPCWSAGCSPRRRDSPW